MGVELKKAISFARQRKNRRQRAREKKDKPEKTKSDPPQRPTAEQIEKNGFYSAKMSYRKIPVIDTMLKRGQLTTLEHTALGYYREQATAADKSPIKSNIDFSVKAGGSGPMLAMSPQSIETGRIERSLGALQPIARAIAVDDVSISQWCTEKSGGREKLVGKAVVIVPRRAESVSEALEELKDAARRIVI